MMGDIFLILLFTYSGYNNNGPNDIQPRPTAGLIETKQLHGSCL